MSNIPPFLCSIPRLYRGEQLAQGAADFSADSGAGGHHFRGAGGVLFQVGVCRAVQWLSPVPCALPRKQKGRQSLGVAQTAPCPPCSRCQHEQKEFLQNYLVGQKGPLGTAASSQQRCPG